jgi:histidine triad (HIT) family protein
VDECVFCDIVAGRAPAEQVYQDERAIGIVPLNPVVAGHLLAIPRMHATDFDADWRATADATHAAFQMARLYLHGQPYNVITSKGRAATQSVFHLHLHLVPRAEKDRLALPWYSGR